MDDFLRREDFKSISMCPIRLRPAFGNPHAFPVWVANAQAFASLRYVRLAKHHSPLRKKRRRHCHAVVLPVLKRQTADPNLSPDVPRRVRRAHARVRCTECNCPSQTPLKYFHQKVRSRIWDNCDSHGVFFFSVYAPRGERTVITVST